MISRFCVDFYIESGILSLFHEASNATGARHIRGNSKCISACSLEGEFCSEESGAPPTIGKSYSLFQ